MDVGAAVYYSVGLLLLLALLQILVIPLQWAFRILGNTVMGAFTLWILNTLGSPLGWYIGLNPASAIVAGLFGIPGVVGLGILRWIAG